MPRDQFSGFLGLEVFQVHGDSTVFPLVTRWTDRPSYETWHRSEAHHASHAFIPRGLKLEASYTRLTVLDRIDATSELPSLTTVLGDAAPTFAAWLADAATTCVAVLDRDGRHLSPNGALAERLGMTSASAAVAEFVANDEAEELAARIARLRAGRERGTDERFLVNFVSASQSPFTLACRIDAQPEYVFLFGEPQDTAEQGLVDQVLQSNNPLAVLARGGSSSATCLRRRISSIARARRAGLGTGRA